MSAEPSLRADSSPFTHLMIGLALAFAVLTVVGQTLRHDFVGYDDPIYILDNPHIAGGLTLESIRWSLTGTLGANWFPLTFMSHALDLTMFGRAPGGHHATNLLLHLANTLLLYAALFRMTGAIGRSAAVAALFAVHPLHVESVAWVTERKGLLAGLFFMLALLAYERYTRKPAAWRYALVALAFVLGLMSKASAITLPFLLLLLDLWPLERIPRTRPFAPALSRLALEKLPLLLIALAGAAITVWAQSTGGAVKTLEAMPVLYRIGNAIAAYGAYVRMTLWPTGLAPLYPHPGANLDWSMVAAAALALLAITAVAIVLLAKRSYLFVGWCWFLGMLVPVIGLVQVGGQAYADRYTYLPLIGLFIAGVWLLADALQARRPLVQISVATAIVLLFAGVAWVQTRYWRDSYTLYSRALAVTENNAVMHNNMGSLLLSDGHPNLALQHLRAAIDIKPDYALALVNLADATRVAGDLETAFEYYARALDVAPDSAVIRNNYALSLLQAGHLPQAVVVLREGLAIVPDDATLHNSLGAVYLRQGRVGEAAQAFREALRLRPEYVSARENLERIEQR